MKRRMMAVLLTLCMVLSMFPAVTFAAGTGFDDMDGHWAETIVETWAGRGVVSGVGDNKFAPDKTLSRAELAQVIANLLKLVPSKNAPKFDDVDGGAWYSTAVGACAEEDIVSGIGGNKFGPALTATREQCMTIFCKVFGIEPLEDTSVLNQFADKDSVSNWAMVMNVSRSSLHRELKKLETDGIITYDPPTIEIHDTEALQNVLSK